METRHDEAMGAPAAKPGVRMLTWTSFGLVLIGVLAVGMVVATNSIAERQVTHYAPIERAVADLRVAVSTSHLWLEEYLTGDPRVDPRRDVLDELDRADAVLAALREGGAEGTDLSAVRPLVEDELRVAVDRVAGPLDRFRSLAEQRLGAVETSGVGSEIDQVYDEVFRHLLAEVHDLEHGIERRTADGLRRARILFASILITWGSLIALAMAALHHRVRRQRATEQQLRERDQQLRQAQKLEAVGRLAGGLAHDVNNYLATINAQAGLVQVLHDDVPGLGSMMDDVIATVGKTTGLLHRLLAFSREQPMVRRVIDLNRVTTELGSMMRRLLRDDVRLELSLSEEVWPVEADPTQVEQVLVNLVVNAREALPDGGTVTIRTAPAAVPAEEAVLRGVAAGAYTMLAVADDGVGVPEELRERIFEPFFSTKQVGNHSGLGLATVFSIVQQSAGFVRVESETGVGTTFRLFLPKSERELEVESEVVSAETIEGRRGRVLVVEDNTDLRRATAAVLTAVGHDVEAAADGDEGLARLRLTRVPYDVVVTDLVMPGASGRAIAEQVLAGDHGHVVIVSGFRDRIEVEDLLDSPRVRYLDKPVATDVLLSSLDELLAGD